jgi:hypothetical protein
MHLGVLERKGEKFARGAGDSQLAAGDEIGRTARLAGSGRALLGEGRSDIHEAGKSDSASGDRSHGGTSLSL